MSEWKSSDARFTRVLIWVRLTKHSLGDERKWRLKCFFFQGIIRIVVEVMKHILTVFKYNLSKRGTEHAYYNICVYVYTYIS